MILLGLEFHPPWGTVLGEEGMCWLSGLPIAGRGYTGLGAESLRKGRGLIYFREDEVSSLFLHANLFSLISHIYQSFIHLVKILRRRRVYAYSTLFHGHNE